ncbi:MAG: PadR family transcriptional regulator [Erysipelotrichaceae bacterium]|jgi:PadR family transcriptional regulator PadR|nr:PadR family transcriptional regulator [Erysipelotrichaceae bacterium]
MNVQFKKGVLELVVLLAISDQDKYGYQLVSDVSKIIDVNEGTIYPLLKRLTNERYFETYLQESSEGPPRKYYALTKKGALYRDNLKQEWLKFVDEVNAYITKEEKT